MIKPTKYYQRIWSLFDWANTVWPVVIITFVFPNYFINNVCQDSVLGNVYWANTMTISGVLIAILAPFLGSIADSLNNATFWLRLSTYLNIICAFMLWFVKPDPDFIQLAMVLIIFGSIAFEISTTFYNTYLSHISSNKAELSRISGLAWGLGYTAGICCLLMCIFIFIMPAHPLFGLLDPSKLEHIRVIGPVVGSWYLIFSFPLLIERLKPEEKIPDSIFTIMRNTKRHIIQSIRKTKDQPYIYYYLIVRMLYTDGINTLFAFAGIYAATTFNMSFQEIMYFGIACNVSAGLGCFFASWSDSKFGEPSTIVFNLTLLIAFLSSLLLVESLHWFWVLSLCATFFVGPIQTSSRSLMAKICPPEAEGEFFGLYALSGKVSAFLGPLLLGFIVSFTQSQKLGMASINLFFLIGLLGMLIIKIPKHLVTQTTTD